MPRFSANLGFLYPELPFLDRFAAAASDGFAAVEYPLPFDHESEQLADLLYVHGLVQALFNMPPGDWAAGERGIACLPDRIEEFRAGVATTIRYARALGCTKVNCLAGLAPEGVAEEVLDAIFVENLGFAAPLLAAAGISLLIEPINSRDMPGFHLATNAHAERILDAVASPDLLIQYDFYHAQVMRGDLVAEFERLYKRIGHVQIADNPGRSEPGTGEINFPYIFAALDRLGYAGWVGCEYKPFSGRGGGTEWMKAMGVA